MNAVESAFWEFHAEHPRIYERLKTFTQKMIVCGRVRLLINNVFERVRWDEMETGKGLELNNNHRAFYARVWMKDHPQFPKFFAIRKTKAS